MPPLANLKKGSYRARFRLSHSQKAAERSLLRGDSSNNVHIHYTPTYSSWLNQVELWFNRIQRDVIARGVFTSVADLKRKLMRYIRQYNKAPKPIKPGFPFSQ